MSAGGSSRVRSWLLEEWPGCLHCYGTSLLPVSCIRSNANEFSEESEKVSELKSVSGSNKLPYGTLASGTEGIKDAINGFDDAYVLFNFV